MIEGFEFQYADIVRYGDCDLHQHMNHARYFTFMEQARTVGYLEAMGMRVTGNRESIPFILANASCDYRMPAEINDEVVTHMAVTRIGAKSMTMAYRMVRGSDQLLLAEATTVMVSFDYVRMCSVPVPQSFKDAVNALKIKAGCPPLP